MGGGSSTATHVYPAWYIEPADVTVGMADIAKKSFGLIANGEAAPFLEWLKSNPDANEDSSGIVFFYNTFYDRLFDVYPVSRELFRSSLKVQGNALVKMVSTALSLLHKDHTTLVAALTALAERHAAIGVYANEYGIVGDVLLWTLARCVGPNDFTEECKDAWLRIYCFMLSVIIPTALKAEEKIVTQSKKRGVSRMTSEKGATANETSMSNTVGNTRSVKVNLKRRNNSQL